MYKKVKTLLFSAALLLCCITASAVGTQPSAGDGSQANPYQIATSDNLVWFAEHVNSGNASACAILTADIVVNSGVLNADGTPNGTPQNIWTPIGGFNGEGNDYSGEFNGNGHTISGLYFNDGTKNNVGLFGKATDGANIHDVGVSDSYFYGKDHVGGICGDFANGLIENCWSEVSIYVTSGDGGGLTGSVFTNAVLKDCYSICNVSGNGSRGLVCGALTGTIENCYAKSRNSIGTTSLIGWTSGEGPHTATNVEIKDAAAFASGEVCWLLNSGVTDGSQKWYQTLNGTDNFPMLDNSHGTVYYGYDGNVLKYSNTQPDAPIHIVSYVDADGQEQTAVAVEITNGTSTLNAGWYVVTGDSVSTGTLTCNGEVHLILADGAKLTAKGEVDGQAGITVSGEGNSLTIYGQTDQSGQLKVTGGFEAAGIGGGSGGSGSYITINGGKITAEGGSFAAGIGGGREGSGSNITINGGTVTAKGVLSAGIGGGEGGSGSYITINDGVVTATGGQRAAGIGGGSGGSGSYITINDGTITAEGGLCGAGIGGGNNAFGSNITINGGKVTANGGCFDFGHTVTANCEDYGASIGGGWRGTSSNIFVAVGYIIRADNSNPPTTEFAPDRTDTTDIASGLASKRCATIRLPLGCIVTYGDYITVSPEFASGDSVPSNAVVTFTAANRFAENYEFIGFYKESTFENKITQGVSGLTYTVTTTETETDISVYAKYEEFTPVPYIDADGREQNVNAAEITNETFTLNAGWYVVTGGDVQTGTLTCNGAVHLILADGAKLTAQGGEYQAGITVSGNGDSLTIYGQAAQSGKLIATGGRYSAGIGGGNNGSGSNITINGGEITAKGEYYAAGIGGGGRGSGSNIIINRGKVTATGGRSGAGIGGGNNGSGSNITINGGAITATGGEYGGAGIGGGNESYGSNIKVAAALTVYADNTNPPTTEISHADNDIASHTALRHVIVKDVATGIKDSAIAAINAAIEGVTNEDIIAIATNAINAINAATSADVINAIKEQALAAIAALKAAYAASQAEAFGEMGTPCDDCPAVEVSKGTTTIRLYNPDKVEFKKE